MIEHVEKPLTEFKPRKATYGFKGSVSPGTMLSLADAMNSGLTIDPELVVETNFNMGSNEFKIYTNNLPAALVLRHFVK